ncbi:hypothetical protein [Nocardia sp. NPDC049526]|uniref:hypothetical protein n=1 Tax=Nocardia sp. NPDC049526 TaxID=3364316 RepID=UPI0037BBF886
MRIRRMVIGGVAAVATLVGVSFGAAGQAAAASANFGTLRTLGSICIGGVNSYVWDIYNRSGVLGGQMTFDLWTPTFGQPCTVGVSVNWRNLDSGATGTYSSVLTGNGTFDLRSQQFELPTGPGRVALSLTTDRPDLPVPDTEIVVP